MNYQYDAASRLTRITWPDTYFIDYEYDLTNAMVQLRENGATSGAGLLAAWVYDDLGRRTLFARGNGVSTTYGWNGGSQLTALVHNLSGTAQDQTFTYSTNPVGQLSARNAVNDAYAYDDDPSLADGYTINGLNQVTYENSQVIGYDTRQNITGDGTSYWSYDVYNRLTGAGGATLSYDPLGRLGLIDGGSDDRQFLYAGAQAIGEYDGSTLISRYVPGAGLDDYAAYTQGTSTITRQWPIADQLGSVIGITDGSAVASQINAYDEYGVPATGNAGRFGYAGSMFLPQGGEAPWHMRNRQYHPGLGRFLQTDPIGLAGGVNLYAYVGGDPVNLIDPFGLQEEDCDPADPQCVPTTEVPPIEVVGINICNEDYAVCDPDQIAGLLALLSPDWSLPMPMEQYWVWDGTSWTEVFPISQTTITCPNGNQYARNLVNLGVFRGGLLGAHSHPDWADRHPYLGDWGVTGRLGIPFATLSRRGTVFTQMRDGQIDINVARGSFDRSTLRQLERAYNRSLNELRSTGQTNALAGNPCR